MIDKSLITYDALKKTHEDNGYIWREGVYDLNTGGVRATVFAPNVFDDLLYHAYVAEDGLKCVALAVGTTHAGTYYLQHPMNPDGCFLLAPGQYVASHTKGLHYGKPAYVQIGPLRGWRDNNLDTICDYGSGEIYQGVYAVDVHRMGAVLKLIENWSAGCNGCNDADMDYFLSLYDKMVQWTGRKTIDWTLLEQKDFD